jgi:hypothetical protein
MKRLLSFTLPIVLVAWLGAWAQTDTTPSPNSTNPATSPSSSSSTQSNTQDSTTTEANPATSSTMSRSAASAGHTGLEGCIIQRNTSYFLEPDHGTTGTTVKLESSQDLSQHLGHRVRVEGTVKSGTSSTNAYGSTSSASSTVSTPSPGQSGNQVGISYQEMRVTKVETISETCPSALEDHNNTRESPK